MKKIMSAENTVKNINLRKNIPLEYLFKITVF
jgi:hypothetical protein